ncbi:hypothetical protein J057_15330 [Marinobacter nanhaiticus D15-8W]|uniref:Lipase modulator n=1 Tax=Marinobacter nanhaiticus D15-8W TaxID=626887 RepID=N6WP20_9GAMM|nr:hypothetical protein J057_15330 [Marinobacter nanhaiticus D15-8W]
MFRTNDRVTRSPDPEAIFSETGSIASKTGSIAPKTEPSAGSTDHIHTKEAAAKSPASGQADEIPFTVDEVYAVARTMNLDESDNLALGNDTLLALDRLFLNGAKTLSEQDLQNLRELIQAGLPGETGQKAAKVATDYYNYLAAQSQLMATHRPKEGSANRLSGEQLYRELRQLQTMHMGEEVADQLFRTADAQFAYMTQALRLQTNTDLTQAQKLDEAQKLGEALQEASIGVADWPQRRDRFQVEKRLIVEAALPKSEKRAQVQALLKRHFRPYELEHIKHLQLDNL